MENTFDRNANRKKKYELKNVLAIPSAILTFFLGNEGED